MGMLTKLMKDMIIPVKELFLRHNVPAYISTSHLEEQNKLGFVLSVNHMMNVQKQIYILRAVFKRTRVIYW